MVNHESGLLGVSETSSDMRDLLAREAEDVRAAEAVALFCYQAKKWVGAFAAALGGLDTLVFSRGHRRRTRPIRARICDGLGFLGIELDETRNAAQRGGDLHGRQPGRGPRHSHRRRIDDARGRWCGCGATGVNLLPRLRMINDDPLAMRSMNVRKVRDERHSAHRQTVDLLRKMDAYWRAANYLSVGQIYLYDNPLLKKPLDAGAHQAAPARPLGHDAGAELHLRPPEPRHQGARPEHDLHHRAGPRRARAGGQRLPGGHLQRGLSRTSPRTRRG